MPRFIQHWIQWWFCNITTRKPMILTAFPQKVISHSPYLLNMHLNGNVILSKFSITSCNECCHFENSWCSQWRQFHRSWIIIAVDISYSSIIQLAWTRGKNNTACEYCIVNGKSSKMLPLLRFRLYKNCLKERCTRYRKMLIVCYDYNIIRHTGILQLWLIERKYLHAI